MADNRPVSIKFEPRDIWIGVYWDRRSRWLFVYVCIIPMLPIVIKIRRHKYVE